MKMSPTVGEKADRFWGADLEEIEGSFLKGKKITDLPVRKLDNRVPSQGSVLLDRFGKTDRDLPRMNPLKAFFTRIFRRPTSH